MDERKKTYSDTEKYDFQQQQRRQSSEKWAKKYGQVAVTSASISGDKTMAHPMRLRLGKAIEPKVLPLSLGKSIWAKVNMEPPCSQESIFINTKGKIDFIKYR